MAGLRSALSRHVRFYIALVCGAATFAIAVALRLTAPLLAAGDVFYLVFLVLMLEMVAGQSTATLKLRAKSQDEGIAVVVLVMLVTMGYFCAAVFIALNKKHGAFDPLALVLAGVGAPLGWLALQAVMAFHYADVHYFDDPDARDDQGDLEFPGTGDPGPWDFLYYSFVVGMTCQVSDVQVLTTPMRKLTLFHGVVAFFFNTVFIAMAVNAGVALAS